MSLLPSVSIITICYNAEKFIEQTIQSVLNQTYPDIQYIIIDGASTDRTIDIIEKYKESIDVVLSELDNGIADAMNKAIPYCNGDYILFLHADDFLISEHSIQEAAKLINKTNQQYDIYSFGIRFGELTDYAERKSKKFNCLMNIKTQVWHQGAFCKRKMFDSVGYFNPHYRIATDYDWFLRAYRARVKFLQVITLPSLSFMRDVGISSRKDWASMKERLDEEKKIHYLNCNNPLLYIMYHVWWLLYPSYKKLVSMGK